MTLYEKTNNPLNIRFNKDNNWKGQTTTLRGFVVFKTPEYGYRAAYVLLCNYIRKGYNTPRKIITRWAHPRRMIQKRTSTTYQKLWIFPPIQR